jgi:hypothetical protein
LKRLVEILGARLRDSAAAEHENGHRAETQNPVELAWQEETHHG